MLRNLAALIFPFIAGCVSTGNPTLNCEIVSFVGHPASLSGPVRLEPSLEAALRPQLPSEFKKLHSAGTSPVTCSLRQTRVALHTRAVDLRSREGKETGLLPIYQRQCLSRQNSFNECMA